MLFKKYKSLPVQVKATLWFVVCSFLQKGISVITTPVFTRLLSTTEYGNYSVFNSWLSIVTMIVTLNLWCGTYTQGLIKFEDERDVYASSIQGLMITMCTVWLIIYVVFRDFWNGLFSLTTVQMLAMFVMIWATAAFNLWSTTKRVEYDYRSLLIVTIMVSIAKPLLGIILVLNSSDKVTARILGITLVELIGYSWTAFSQICKGKTFFCSKFWKYSLVLNIPLLPHALSQTVLSSSDRIMIDTMVGASQAGIYSLAYSVAQIMILFNTALSQTIAPWTYQRIKTKEIDRIASVAYPTIGIIAVLNLLLIMLAPEAIAIFAPNSYGEGVALIPPIAMSTFFLFLYDYFARFEYYYEKTSFIMIASVLAATLNVVLNYFCISLYGYAAAAYTTLFCYIVYAATHYLYMKKICKQYLGGKEPYNIKFILGISISFLILGFVILATYSMPIARYIIILIIAVIVLCLRKKLMNLIKNIMSLRDNEG